MFAPVAVASLLLATGGLREDPAITARREIIINDIARTTGVSRQRAVAIENRLEKFIDRLEARLQYFVADFPADQKAARIDETIREFFVDSSARIQVSSVTTDSKESYYVNEYLNNLIQLRRSGRYIDIRLDFVKWDYNGMNRVADRSGTYEAAVSVWQVFVGSGEVGGYADETRKDLRLLMKLGPNNSVTFVVQEISVAQTTSRRDLLNGRRR